MEFHITITLTGKKCSIGDNVIVMAIYMFIINSQLLLFLELLAFIFRFMLACKLQKK